MVALNQLTVVTGILVTNLVNYSFANYGEDAWRWMFGLGVVPSALFFLGALGLPESPRWLAKVGKKEAALKILKRFGGVVFANQSLTQIESTLSNSVQKTTYSELFKKGVFAAILIGIGLAVFQQLSGINTVFNYAPKFSKTSGLRRMTSYCKPYLLAA